MKNSKIPLIAMIAVVVITLVLVCAYPAIMNGKIKKIYENAGSVNNSVVDTAIQTAVDSGTYLGTQILIGMVGMVGFLITLKWFIETKNN